MIFLGDEVHLLDQHVLTSGFSIRALMPSLIFRFEGCHIELARILHVEDLVADKKAVNSSVM